jgi:ATP-dependent protease ClpP protease subunit
MTNMAGNETGKPRSLVESLPRACVHNPHVRLSGQVNADMFRSMLNQLAEIANDAELVAIEISTPGGDAEVGRRLVLEINLARERFKSARFVFIGKTNVYSAGVTLMSAFPQEDRFLSSDAVMLIHCRQLEKTIEISGPMRASLPKLNAVREQIEVGKRVEEADFERLIEGSDIQLEELLEHALHNWYMPADEALRRGLIAGIV